MECFFHSRYTFGMEGDTVGSLIKRQREAAKLTQKELGEAIDISDRQISEWERGRALPSRDSIKAMSRVFRISADEFLQRLRWDIDDATVIAEELERKQGHGPERQRASYILEDLIDHPDLWEQWMAYGEYLLTRRQ